MATLTKRYNRDGDLIGWQAKVRRQGYPTQSKSFSRKSDAETWARDIESGMDKGAYVDRRPAEQLTFADALHYYLEHEVPKHKGSASETYRLKRILREETKLTPVALANYCLLQTHQHAPCPQ